MPSRVRSLFAILLLALCAGVGCRTPIPIVEAGDRGDLRTLDELLSEGVPPDTTDVGGVTALHRAARGGHTPVVERLLESGADPNKRTQKGTTPLLAAAREGHADIVALLLERGADPAAANEKRETALHVAADRQAHQVMELLLRAGAPVDARDEDRETALWKSVARRDHEGVSLLLESAAAPDIPDRDGETPLYQAAKDRDLGLVVALLEKGAAADGAPGSRETPVWESVRNRDTETAAALLKAGANPNRKYEGGRPLLLIAVQNRDVPTTRLLLEAGADPNARDIAGVTSLFAATQNRDLSIVKALLDNRADPDAVGPGGLSPIVVAKNNRDVETTQLLLEAGADPSRFETELADPIGFASKYGYSELAKAYVADGLAQASRAMRDERVAPAPPVPPVPATQPDGAGFEFDDDDPGPSASDRVDASYEPFYSRRVAVVVGIDEYTRYPALEGAREDAARVAKSMRAVGFDPVIELYDERATRGNLLRALGSELAAATDRESIAFVYFAGHGETETLRNGQKRGYIVPADADPDDSFTTAISMDVLRDLSNRLPAKQIYFAMDSCYSGLGLVRGIRKVSGEGEGFVRKITSMRAVQMITAGSEGEQAIEVNGRGLFTQYFLRAVDGEADFDRNGFVTASEIGAFVRPQVTNASRSRQTPQFGTLEGAGEVAFEVR